MELCLRIDTNSSKSFLMTLSVHKIRLSINVGCSAIIIFSPFLLSLLVRCYSNRICSQTIEHLLMQFDMQIERIKIQSLSH